MTHAQQQGHGHGHGHGHGGHDAFTDDALAEMLDLDAEIVAPQLREIVEFVGAHAPEDARLVVDLGAGTGTGSAALARRFPDASVVAVDGSAAMVNRLRANGFTATQSDLDSGWPEVGSPDVVWAASSLHHLSDVERVLRDAHAATKPGALLAVVEMDDQPRILDDDAGRALEDRAHEVMAAERWNAHPDWTGAIESAGFAVVEKRRFELDDVPPRDVAVRYGRAFLTRVRAGIGDKLPAADRETLDQLLADGVLEQTDLRVRVTRTLWLARR
ncbi:class I SAM-dependent methyltransferase [Pseudonocardia endophytica]|uniref:Methyltransferase family protein n=1 Tax=Pseudonocardia endophytica TaxID=401976 RepID=A0A4R1HLC6_PSEEN|nr:class I SAM-dependent methyltransferase [Pseudonocardia endophytica]TCK21901.1 methyltransferase family protein [Pseudonocardia endophytica]